MEMKKMKVIFLAITIVPLLVQPMRQIGKKQIQKIVPTALSTFTPSLSSATSHLTTPARHASLTAMSKRFPTTHVPSNDQLASFIPIQEPQSIVKTSNELLLPTVQEISTEPDADAITTSTIIPKAPFVEEAPIIDLAKYAPSQQLFTSQQISSLLQQQPLSLQKIISKHPFYTDFLQEAQQSTFNDTALLKKEIYLYILQHPENASEIMDFYQEIKNEQILIKEQLKKLPPLTQTFFEKELQKYKNIKFQYDATEKNYIKTKICKAFPYVITAIAITVSILGIVLFFLTIIGEEIAYPEISKPTTKAESDLLDIFHLLLDAFDLEPIPLKRINAAKGIADDEIIAYYRSLPFPGSIVCGQHFFSSPLEAQIIFLLHELRHYLQHSSIVIDKETIKYAKSLQVQPYDLNMNSFIAFLHTGFFWSSAMKEFDADLFAARQMKDHKAFQSAAKYNRPPLFNPKEGYLSEELMLKQANNHLPNLQEKWTDFIKELPSENIYFEYIPPHLIPDLQKKLTDFIKEFQNENIYLEYIPPHLIKAAQKNRSEKKEKEQKRKSIQEQYQAYLEW
ncbi:hypothetical protein HYV11_01980 [Candidatus Dependentiae bacterium]|nr:hypothetical protein [Candidatus Dependentiae bacterium]